MRRLKKQEEKRQRRLGKLANPDGEPEVFSPDEAPAAPPVAVDPDKETS